MRQFSKMWVLGVLTMLLLSGLPAPAEDDTSDDWQQWTPKLRFGGSVRVRYEDRTDIQFNDARPGNDDDFLLTRVRLNLDWKPTDLVRFWFEVQDARIFGSDVINEDARPNIFHDTLDVLTAFADFNLVRSGSNPVTLRVGRQKLNFGVQRLVGALEWANTSRVFDGAKMTIGFGESRDLDLFVSRVVPFGPGFNNHDETGIAPFDSDFYGVYFHDSGWIADGVFETYLFIRDADDFDDNVVTLGSRVNFRRGAWDAGFDGALQWGTYRGDDQQAGMFHARGGYNWEGKSKPRLGLTFNYGSGDEDPDDTTHGTFDNLYPTNHKFYGYMDYFSLQNMFEVELAYSMKIKPVNLRLAFHDFTLVEASTDAWYAAPGTVFRRASGDADSHAGSEIDLTLQAPLTRSGLGLLFGYSHFFAGAYVADVGDPGTGSDFVYLQLLQSF